MSDDQLLDLSKPFSRAVIEQTPRGEDYVGHAVVTQALLAKVGPFDFTVAQIVRGDVAAIPAKSDGKSQRAREGRPALSNVVVGVVGRLCCEVDGRPTVVEEVGDCDDPHNWAHDGQRLQTALSDALKRCAMRLGLGLHLWAQEHYALHDVLSKRHQERPFEAAS